MFRLLIRFTPLFIAHLVLSQSSSTADVKNTFFDEGEHDTIRAEAAIQLADNIYNSDLDSAYRLIVKADTWSRKHNYKKGLSITQGYLGFIFHTQGDYLKGIEGYQQSIAYNRKHNFDMNLAMDLGNYGALLNDLNDAKAVDLYKESIAIYKAKNSLEDVAYVYSYIGGYFKGNDEIDSSIYYYNLGLESTSMSDTKAMLLRHLAEAYFKKGDSQEAFSVIDKGINIVSDRNKASQKILLITKLNICNSMGRLDEAEKCIELLEPLKDLDVNRNASVLYNELRASFLYRKGKFQEAYDVINSVYEKQNEYFNDELINLAKRRSLEFEYQEKNRQDSIRAVEEEKINKLKYESKLQEEENHRNILWISIISLLIIIGMIAFGYFRNRRNS
ncbi:MAG: tetratricopeptide repeat protein [Crocinitomicaceae bacterium]